MFPKAIPRTLRNEALDILRNSIVTGVLHPGQHLIETELSDKMGISRSPIREALRSLEQEGLVVAIPNQGCYVKTYTSQEIQEIFTLRASLENLACELLIEGQRMQPSDYASLELLLEGQDRAIQILDIPVLTRLDLDFHAYLCNKAGSALLMKTWLSLRHQVEMLFYQRFRLHAQVPETVTEDHARMMDSLRVGDLEQLVRMNKEINRRVANECIAIFQGCHDLSIHGGEEAALSDSSAIKQSALPMQPSAN